MEQNLSKAFTEVYEILKVTPIELTSKIPTKFRKIIEENHLDVVYLEAVHTVDAVNKARIAVETGAHILVARGYQAKLILSLIHI